MHGSMLHTSKDGRTSFITALGEMLGIHSGVTDGETEAQRGGVTSPAEKHRMWGDESRRATLHVYIREVVPPSPSTQLSLS